MKNKLLRNLVLLLLIPIFIMAFSSTAVAVGLPKHIYYTNQSDELVMVDYNQVVDDLVNNDPRLRNAIRTHLTNSLQNFKSVFVEDEGGTVIDYTKTAAAGLNYLQAFEDATYHASQQSPTKQLKINPVTSLPEEVDMAETELIIVNNVIAVNGNVTVILNGVPATTPLIEDFSISQSINGEAATTVTPTTIAWNTATKTALLTIPLLNTANVDQNVVISAAYKNTISKSAPAFTITGALAIVSAEAIDTRIVEVIFNKAITNPGTYILITNGVTIANNVAGTIQANTQIIRFSISAANSMEDGRLYNLTANGVNAETGSLNATFVASNQPEESIIVYITKTGSRYHRGSCHHLRQSKIPIKLEDAKRQGYTPCLTCKP